MILCFGMLAPLLSAILQAKVRIMGGSEQKKMF